MHSDPLAGASKTPDIKELLKQYQGCSPSANAGFNHTWADKVRFSIWAGQTEDGKKHGTKSDEAFPWEGASDSRSMLVDQVIVENVGVLMTSFWQASVKSKMAWREGSSYGVALADYWVNECMYSDLMREVELAAQYREQYGWFILHPTWEQKIALKRKLISLAELGIYVASNAQSLGVDMTTIQQWSTMIMDESQDETTIQVLKLIWNHYVAQAIPSQLAHLVPEPRDAALRKAVKEFRTKGEAEIVYADLVKNGPKIIALKPYEEVFIPTSTTDIQSARAIFRREYVTAAELRSRVQTDGYDEKWVKLVESKKGEGTSFSDLQTAEGGTIRDALGRGNRMDQPFVQQGDLVEIIHAFVKSVDEDNVPAVYMTTFSGVVTCDEAGNEIYGKAEILDYPHGQYPFVAGAREFWCRRLTSSRGVPEIIYTHQARDKALDDALIDRTSISVIPPLNVYDTPLGSKYRFGPAVQNKVIPGREPRFMETPDGRGINDAMVAKEQIQSVVANYFGMMSEKVPPQRITTVQAKSVGAFMLAWSEAFQQLVNLGQAYISDDEFAAVTGAPAGWLDQRRSQPSLLSAQLQFDVRELDAELCTERIKAMNEVVIPSDVAGVIDRTKWVQVQVRAINPTWAKELVVPGQQASETMFRGVREDLAQMFLGNEAKYSENDPAAKQKLDWAQQIVAANPNYQQALQSNGRFAQLLQKWIDSLTFSLQQQQNKTIGRIGVAPESMQQT